MKSFSRLLCDITQNRIACKPPWRVLFFGTDKFAVKPLEGLEEHRKIGSLIKSIEVVCPAEKRRSKNARAGSEVRTVREFAAQRGLPVHDWHGQKGWPNHLPNGSYDVGIVVSFGYLIPSSVLDMFHCGALNIHPSLLPRWRGAAPIAHTLLNGDKTTGVSIINLSRDKFDAGNILLQQEYKVPEKVMFDELYDDLSQLSTKMLIGVLGDFMGYQGQAKPQSDIGATSAPKITKDMGKVDWNDHTCQQIARLWRTFSTTVGLHTSWEGKQVKLITMDSWVLDIDVEEWVPGQVVYDDDYGVLFIRCQDGWVGFSEVQFECKNVISAVDFANSYLVDKRTRQTKRGTFESLQV